MCGRDGRMLAAWVEQKNEATKHDKNGKQQSTTKMGSNKARQKWRDAPLTKKVPYGFHLHLRQDPSGKIPDQTEDPRGPHAGEAPGNEAGGLYLATQAGDEHVDAAVIGFRATPGNGVTEPVTRQYPARTVYEGGQQRGLGAG